MKDMAQAEGGWVGITGPALPNWVGITGPALPKALALAIHSSNAAALNAVAALLGVSSLLNVKLTAVRAHR